MNSLCNHHIAMLQVLIMDKEERKPKWDIDKEYLGWAWVDFKCQDAKFFKEVKQLPSKGLDPKHELMDEHVTTEDIVSFFGNVKTFKTINPLLPSNARKDIETLYWKINGTSHITNNELMVWFVKGWITKRNGHPINWAKAVATTTKEKVQHLGIGTMNKPKMEKLSTDVNEGS
jgi:hypothetical protein